MAHLGIADIGKHFRISEINRYPFFANEPSDGSFSDKVLAIENLSLEAKAA